jgi:beta-1,4-mannosyltransferase
MRPKAYIYPRTTKTSKKEKGVYNPYRDNFTASMLKYLDFVNKDKPSSVGIVNISKYLYKIDYLFLNWIEDLPDKKWGYVQSVFFLLLLKVKGWFGLKVVWTLHNKISHVPKNRNLKKLLFKELLKKSDLIITHAKEGVEFARSFWPDSQKKIFYFSHPIVPFNFSVNQIKKEYDFLIWGALSPYKGIDLFLQYLRDAGLDNQFKIKILGKAVSHDFFLKLQNYKNNSIEIEDVFIDHADLAQLIDQSYCVLFTYSQDSVLSSGVLIDSVAHRATVIGPYTGAFREMADLGIIKAYNHYTEIPQILENIKKEDSEIRMKNISRFIEAHTWDEFARTLNSFLSSVEKSTK